MQRMTINVHEKKKKTIDSLPVKVSLLSDGNVALVSDNGDGVGFNSRVDSVPRYSFPP